MILNTISTETVLDFYQDVVSVQNHAQLNRFIKRLQDVMDPEVIAEIGFGQGGTSAAWAKLKPKILISIDVDISTKRTGLAAVLNVDRYLHAHGGVAYWLQQDSREIRFNKHFKKILDFHQCKIDFLYIDGEHSYQGVIRDFELFAPLVKVGGVIAFHDISEDRMPDDPDIKCPIGKFWGEVQEAGQNLYEVFFEEFERPGLGALRVKK